MKREEQELLERDEGNERQEEDPVVVQQVDGLEGEFDREFWIKVATLYDFEQRVWIICLILLWGKL